jgi:hypothetical protein
MTENDLTLTFVNVGYGEAILLQRGSFTALIDGGAGDPREYENSTSGRIRGIDYLRHHMPVKPALCQTKRA